MIFVTMPPVPKAEPGVETVTINVNLITWNKKPTILHLLLNIFNAP
jgi:hypothetical protein